MYSSFSLFSFLLSFFVSHVFALTGTFNSPPPPGKAGDYSSNVIYKDGDKLNISFTVDAPVFDIVLWQNGCRENIMIKENASETDFTWTVEVKYMAIPIKNYDNELFGDVAYLGVLDKNGGPFMTSHYFNLSDPNGVRSPVPTTTSAQPSTTSTTTSQPPSTSNGATTTGSTAALATAASTTTAASSPAASAGLSPGAAAGVAIGVILGIALGAVGATLFVLRKRKQSNASQMPSNPGSNETADDMAAMKAGLVHTLSNASSMKSYYKAPLPPVPNPTAAPPAPAYYPPRATELSPDFVRHEAPAESVPVHELPHYPSR